MLQAFLITGLLLFAKPEKPVAIVESFQGEATINGKASLPKKEFNAYLAKDDRISVAPKSKIRIFFFQGAKTQELGPGVFLVGEKGCEAVEKDATIQEVEKPIYELDTLKAGLNTIQRGSGRGAGLILRGPPRRETGTTNPANPAVIPFRGETITDDRPQLQWRPAKDVQTYRVRLTRAGTNQLVWEAVSAKPSLEYPRDAAPLKRFRKYYWEVRTVHDNGRTDALWSSDFTVGFELTPEEIQALGELEKSNQPFELLLGVASYHELGMYSRALPVCERLTEVASGNADAWRLLAECYDQAGRLTDAEKAYEKALGLGFNPETPAREAK